MTEVIICILLVYTVIYFGCCAALVQHFYIRWPTWGHVCVWGLGFIMLTWFIWNGIGVHVVNIAKFFA